MIAMLVSCTAYSAEVPAGKQYQTQFNKLKKAAGSKVNHAKLYIDTSDMNKDVIAYQGTGRIVFTQGEILFNIGHLDQTAHIMAHELGHIANPCRGSSKSCERQADLYAVRLMKKAGLNHCAGGQYWKRMLSIYGNQSGPSHPSFRTRYNYLRCK